MNNQITTLDKTGEVFKVDVVSYEDEQYKELHAISKVRTKFKRGKELENHVMDIYSDKLQMQKEQMKHQLYLALDTAKKKSHEEYLQRIKEIENNMNDAMNNMMHESRELATKHIHTLFSACDEEKKMALQYKESHPERYEKLMEKIDAQETQGWEVIEERQILLLEKHRELFTKTIKLFKDEMDAIE